MIDYITSFEFNSQLALFIYWIPLAICAAVYPFRFVKMYKEDLTKSTEKFYEPSLTIGHIVAVTIGAVCPVINLVMAIFDASASAFKFIGRLLDIPLVPKRNS